MLEQVEELILCRIANVIVGIYVPLEVKDYAMEQLNPVGAIGQNRLLQIIKNIRCLSN